MKARLDEAAEARLQALLAAAYGRPMEPQTIRFIRRGAASWRDGDHAMAAMHLAMTGLHPLREPRSAARRLFMADALIKAGAEPDVIFRALDLEPPIRKAGYKPSETRVQGRWALAGEAGALGEVGERVGAALATLTLGEAVFGVAAITAAITAIRHPKIVFQLAMIPFTNNSPREIYGVPGHPDMRLERAAGDRLWRLTYKDKSGVEREALEQPDGTLKDHRGRNVGYIVNDKTGVKAKGAAISLPAVDVKVDKNEPQLCKAPSLDKPGGGPDSAGRLFENTVKPVINPPPNTTPPGFAVVLPNPLAPTGKVHFDDCQRSTGIMFEYKESNYTTVLHKGKKNYFMGGGVIRKLFDQATRQVQAAQFVGGKHIVWLFADRYAAEFVRKKFDVNENKDLKGIETKIFPTMETIR